MVTGLEFSDSLQFINESTDFVFWVPAGIRSKAGLFTELAEAGHFPDCFGHNWDALYDYLSDLAWIDNKKIFIVHRDLPLMDKPEECHIYLEILQAALADQTHIGREFRVIFPARFCWSAKHLMV